MVKTAAGYLQKYLRIHLGAKGVETKILVGERIGKYISSTEVGARLLYGEVL